MRFEVICYVTGALICLEAVCPWVGYLASLTLGSLLTNENDYSHFTEYRMFGVLCGK